MEGTVTISIDQFDEMRRQQTIHRNVSKLFRFLCKDKQTGIYYWLDEYNKKYPKNEIVITSKDKEDDWHI